MSSLDDGVSETKCDLFRRECREGASPYELAQDEGLERSSVIYHITGECQHDGVGEDPHPKSGFAVSMGECEEMRSRYSENESIEALLDSMGRTWGTVVFHLTGECTHDASITAPEFDREEILRRDSITASECNSLREMATEAGNVMEVANSVDYEYPMILAHVNGECSHDVETPPREPHERANNITRTQCLEIRERYRSSPNIDESDIAADYECSETTVHRHVRFLCSHPPEDSIVTDVDDVQDILETDSVAGNSFERYSVSDIIALNSVEAGDSKEASQDLAEPDYVETTRSRIIRNTDMVHELKSLYDYRCQVCGDRRQSYDGQPYAEGHHLQPLGEPHNGPDEPGNILVLCPDHHADFDYGQITIDTETLEVSHQYDESIDGHVLTVEPAHDLDEAYLIYNNRTVVERD